MGRSRPVDAVIGGARSAGVRGPGLFLNLRTSGNGKSRERCDPERDGHRGTMERTSAMADWSLGLVLLTLALVISSCAMARQAPDFSETPGAVACVMRAMV